MKQGHLPLNGFDFSEAIRGRFRIFRKSARYPMDKGGGSRSARVFKGCRSHLSSERGSVTPLVIAYFLITLITLFIAINVTHVFLERRHLILTLESSLQRAAQQIDDPTYYSGYVERNTLQYGFRGMTTFLPIDCTLARTTFNAEFKEQWQLSLVGRSQAEPSSAGSNLVNDRYQSGSRTLTSSTERSPYSPYSPLRSETAPKVTDFQCDGRVIEATAEKLIELPIIVSFAGIDFLRFSRQQETVKVGLIFGG